jgi:hypothetical protein
LKGLRLSKNNPLQKLEYTVKGGFLSYASSVNTSQTGQFGQKRKIKPQIAARLESGLATESRRDMNIFLRYGL